eukprot:CAMPEP_0185587658 /NCGR_PEP_ID=MMETSP0434-20130131/49981_1 /TAXON_ID=626734 ORGANISM="Favella taraikaensis, Strain Fe Narragansett Bay" /NCGR_SAMPLE_ID=MMETSP0434 /ASSEMBLY_ACC=CAM_ASM_000379 /LENGTH=35 /DNA_ID= /DNA_START= /DNA_END= /DNA_ORIENTATION=
MKFTENRPPQSKPRGVIYQGGFSESQRAMQAANSA